MIGILIYRSTSDGGGAETAELASATGGQKSVSELEALTSENPDDANAWQQLGAAYFDEGHFAKAADAYDRATSLTPGSAALWSALGEARVMASDRDPMPSEAAFAFEKALTIDPKDPRARYFRAVKRDLTGDHEAAISQWLSLLSDTPADAPWHDDLVRTIEQVGKINKIDVASRIDAAQKQAPPAAAPSASLPRAAQAIPGPSQQDLARASAMRPDDQRTMAEGMVERLENRLAGDTSNLDGWIMLMRSRMALEQPDRAAKALKDAVAANPSKASYLRQQAALLGIR
ncbi:tetratricopeptide repeat protein [Novosphingobium malaysiense]|uniref:tetratricopeptide repeat protein n=1 Tax=Novosphingobium malaysiense TaxID=1348853 RepID=UPI001E65D90C|nr:tetratricopeptide repeat protein [Novosphingobium malaysiense]